MTHRRLLAPFAALALISTLTFSACSQTPAQPEEGEEAAAAVDTSTEESTEEASPMSEDSTDLDAFLAGHGLDGMSAHDIIDSLDRVPLSERSDDLMASVRPHEILFTSGDGSTAVMPIDGDKVYISIAPYVTQTHDCHFHSLTTCVGELQNQEVEVTIRDAATGEVLFEGPERTYDNGFIGFWLPRGIEAEVTIEADGKSATEVLPTSSDEDRTCVTTMQLT